ncbi:hypothetical protein PQX77_020427 [Marasmius sp. AFHP31]|nr:hypothetical protein PQX77_020427 [Marasmius sp. AFHP31]
MSGPSDPSNTTILWTTHTSKDALISQDLHGKSPETAYLALTMTPSKAFYQCGLLIMRSELNSEMHNAESEHIRLEELAKNAKTTRQKEALKAKKKKPKLGSFEQGKLAPNSIMPRPLAFASQEIRNQEYVELDYWTAKGLSAAAKSIPNTLSNDTFTFLQGDNGGITLQPTLSNLSSKSVCPDNQLTFAEMSTAKTRMLEDIKQANWPDDHIVALITFFHHLKNHLLCHKEHGEEFLVQYQAKT